MKTHNIRTLEGEMIQISEYDIVHMKMVKRKDKYQLHLYDRIINVDKSVINMFSFVYPYITLINI
jgi:hypothetical protein